ncbi:2884_t:CDS:2, partial [Funneliformis mosseae]
EGCLDEKQDNNDYENWLNTLSVTQSTTIVQNIYRYQSYINNENSQNGLDLNGNQYVSLNKQRQYYVHVWGLVKQANRIACKNCDESFDDQENIGQIQNLIIRRPKGRPAGTVRFKGPLETSNEVNKSRKCGFCNESGLHVQ